MTLASRKLGLTRLVLRWERMCPAVTALAGLVGLIIAFALFDLAPLLPGWLHAVLLVAAALAAAGLVRHIILIKQPSWAEAARRLERDGGLAHRPLAALDDRLAAGDEALWQAHRRRMAEAVTPARPGWPDPVLPARDPFALRFAVLLLVVVAAAGGWGDLGGRLRRAVIPAVTLPGLGPDTLEAWITPPTHTRLAPLVLRREGGEQILAIPQGSTLTAVIRGGWGRARLIQDGGATMARPDHGGQRIDAVIGEGGRLAIAQGWRTIAGWPISVVRDALPSIALAAQPEPDEAGRLLVEADASDDYGLAKAWLELAPLDEPTATPLRLDLALPGDAPRNAHLSARFDLAAHDWAGRTVRLLPLAEDGAGQSGTGEPTIVTLPERLFRHPIAHALAAGRRQVSDAPRLGPELAERLSDIQADPDAFGGDERVVLALALARRLLAAPAFDRDEIRDLLWNAALRVEDGGLPAAERDLDDARRDLDRALAGTASPEALAALLDRVQMALERWLDALAQRGLSAPPSPGARSLDDRDLSDMMDDLRGLAQSGDREALRRRLEDLSRLLSEVERAGPGGDGNGPNALDQKIMARLGELARRQQDLLDQSFRHSAPGPDRDGDDLVDPAPPVAAGPGDSARAAQTQRGLADELDSVTRSLADAPPAFAEARRAMNESARSLARGDWAAAAERQGDALSQLREGARTLVDRMEAGKGRPTPGVMARDPFGRARPGATDDGATKVPGQAERRRARDIQDEVRRRAAEPERPPPEHDYLRRLLNPY